MFEQLINIYPAIIDNMSPYCSICFEKYRKIPIVIDDAAMIVGGTVKTVVSNLDAIRSELANLQAVMTEDGHLFCIGANEYEAKTCSDVLEKNAEVYIKALKLGNPVILDDEHCRSEHAGYVNSYSRNEKAYQDEQ